MKLDPAGEQALYRQLADGLRGQILSGELAPGQRLPSEPELAEHYNVARNTVRLALGLLRAEGLVHTGRGRGTFVAADPSAVPLREPASRLRPGRGENVTTDAFVTWMAERGRSGRMEISVERLSAPEEIASRLGLADDEDVIVRRRLQLVDERPSALADTWYRAQLVEGTEIARAGDVARGTDRVLAALGHEVVRRHDEIGARMPTPVEAQNLGIAGGVPVITRVRTGFDAQDEPVAVYVGVFPTDRHVLVYETRSNG
ncbi:MAG: putative transcriptional regulator, GntR family [Actinobacteria bacterium]|nr:putative transcriptional regulator, GntR family [Actinomycetota bacterium]